MTDTKTYVFPEGGNNDMLTAAMMNGGMNGGMWNNPIWAIVFLAALRNGGVFGGDCGSVRTAINSVQSAICGVGNQVGMSSASVINAINSGNMALTNTLQSCCCDVKTDVIKMGYENQINNLQQSQLIQNGFSQVGYASAEQTCSLKQNANDNTNRVIAKLDSIEDSRKDREIASLTAALTAANSRAERQAELAPIYKALGDIQCKQPNTLTIPYSPVTAVPNCVAWQAAYGLNGLGLNNGQVWS